MFVDYKKRLDDSVVQRIMGYAMFDPSPQGIEKEIQLINSDPSALFFAWVDDGLPLGICSFEIHGDKIEVHLIAVDEAARGRGIGGAMIRALQSRYHKFIEAETDDDAVNFYRKIGFTVLEFVHETRGKRYTCTLPCPVRNLSDLLKNIPYTVLSGNVDCDISHITIDSRTVSKNALFICIKGLNVDGHMYMMEATRATAAAILIEDKQAADDFLRNVHATDANATLPTIIHVNNTRKAMGTIAANFHNHPARKLHLIGVTGTNGKTTTTHFIENILRKNGRKTGLIGTAGILVDGVTLPISFATATTPDPLELHAIFAEMVRLGVQDVVMEVSSHALALHKMEGLIFDIGVFTNLTQDHLDFHGTMQNYHDAKALLFKISKAAVMNADDPASITMLKHFTGAPCLWYSLLEKTDLYASNVRVTSNGMAFDLTNDATTRSYTLPILGRFNVYNCLAAMGVAQLLGITPDTLLKSVAAIDPVRGRFQLVPNDRGVLVIVDYAHSPDGLDNIIKAVRDITSGRVITLFGCGGDRDKEKRPQMGRVAAALSDYIIITSDNPRTESPMEIIHQTEVGVRETHTPYQIHENRREAIHAGINMLHEGDALIIAGKGHEDYQIIGTTKHHFDDVEVAREVLCN